MKTSSYQKKANDNYRKLRLGISKHFLEFLNRYKEFGFDTKLEFLNHIQKHVIINKNHNEKIN
jgi:hypothetical protein